MVAEHTAIQAYRRFRLRAVILHLQIVLRTILFRLLDLIDLEHIQPGFSYVHQVVDEALAVRKTTQQHCLLQCGHSLLLRYSIQVLRRSWQGSLEHWGTGELCVPSRGRSRHCRKVLSSCILKKVIAQRQTELRTPRRTNTNRRKATSIKYQVWCSGLRGSPRTVWTNDYPKNKFN